MLSVALVFNYSAIRLYITNGDNIRAEPLPQLLKSCIPRNEGTLHPCPPMRGVIGCDSACQQGALRVWEPQQSRVLVPLSGLTP